ncbi:MAG: M14 family zinc carboxypeptidase [Myxococcota bacterium]
MKIAVLAMLAVAYELPTLDPAVEKQQGDGEIVRLRYPAAARYTIHIQQGDAGLRVSGRFIQPFEGGKDSGPRTWLGSARKGRRFLDVMLLPAGKTMVATFLDGESGSALAVATFSRSADAPLQHAATAYRRQPTRFDHAYLGRGPLLTAVVKKADPLPAGTVALEPAQRGTVVRTDPLGLELLVHAKGYSPTQVTAEMPWRYADPDYLRAEKSPPAEDLAAHYKNIDHVQALLEHWAGRHPDTVRLERIGESRQGRPLLALGLGNFAAKKKLLFNGSHHGDEVLTVDVILDIAEELLAGKDPLSRQVLAETAVWLVPMVNPDGNHAFLNRSTRAGRKNGRDTNRDGRRGIAEGVDLNRNYPTDWATLCGKGCSRSKPLARDYRGDVAGSEPETRAMMGLAEREKFTASISYHMGLVAVLLPHPAGSGHGELGALGEAVTQALGRHPSGPRYALRESSRTVRGADQDYHWHEHGTLALLVEMYGWPPPATRDERRRVLESVRPAWRTVAQWVLR